MKLVTYYNYLRKYFKTKVYDVIALAYFVFQFDYIFIVIVVFNWAFLYLYSQDSSPTQKYTKKK